MQELNIKMGEMKLVTKPNLILATPNLGSCVALAAHDKKSRMTGLAHVVLPDSSINKEEAEGEKPGKYADTAVQAILGKMLALGVKKESLIIKIAGGTQIFSSGSNSSILNIGQRNVEALKKAIDELGLTISREDTGGNYGRALKINAMTGIFYLKIIGQEEIEF